MDEITFMTIMHDNIYQHRCRTCGDYFFAYGKYHFTCFSCLDKLASVAPPTTLTTT